MKHEEVAFHVFMSSRFTFLLYNRPMISRIDVRTSGADPFGESIRHQIQELGQDLGPIRSARIFLIDSDALLDDVNRIARELLADRIVEEASIVSAVDRDINGSRIEIHLKPGVMD